MATLEVNNQIIQLDTHQYLNLKSLLPRLQKEFPFDLYTLAYFKINGRVIDINSDDPSLIRPIEEQDNIQIHFDKNETYMADIVFETHELANKIISQIMNIASSIDEDINDVYLKKISTIIQAVDTFIQSIAFISQNSPDHITSNPNLPFKELHIHLLSVMKAIDTAQNTKDYIMLADLLEYELKDNLTQWKILIMPTLRKQVQINL